MASKIKGTSTADLLNMSAEALNKMNEQQLRQAVSRMADAANKRVNRIEKSGASSQAVAAFRKSGQGQFSTKGRDLNQLRAEYARIKNFMTSATGSVKGAQKVEKQVITGLSEKGVNISKNQYNDFWKAYEKLKERDPSIANRQLKYTVLQNVANEMENPEKSVDEIVNDIYGRLSEIYESEMVNDELSDFFELF